MAPEGFEVWQRSSPFLELLGVLWVDERSPEAPVFALQVDRRHLNSRGAAHGGVLSALADMAQGYSALRASPEHELLTQSMSVQFLSAARLGDLMKAYTSVDRIGSTTAFTTCRLMSGSSLIATSSAAFSVRARA